MPQSPGVPAAPGATANPYAAAGPYGADYAQAAAVANAQITPLVSALASQIQRQTTAGIGAIQGYTGQLAQSLAGEQQKTAGIWGAAQQAQRAEDAAFANRLAGGGAELAGDLSQRTASINAPAVTGQAAANVAQTGAGAGNAAYGMGSASLSQMLAQGAAAQDYSAKLPGLAGLGGIQATRDLGLQQEKLLADKSAEILAQQPGLQNQALSYIAGQRQQGVANRAAEADARAKARQQAFENIIARGYDPVTGKLTPEARLALARLNNENNRSTAPDASLSRTYGHVVDSNGNAILGPDGKEIPIAKPKGKTDTPKPNASLSRVYGHVVDQFGNPITDKNGNWIPVKKPPQSAADTVAARSKAATDAEKFYYGDPPKEHAVQVKNPDGSVSVKWVPVPGTGTPGLSYQDAAKRLQAKYPNLSKQQILEILNVYYAPGEDGRPGGPKTKPVTPSDAASAVAPPSWITP